MRQKQYLLSDEFKFKKEFGGALLKKSHAKKPRPISTKNAMHLTLRSSRAKGDKSFLASRSRRLLIEKKIHAVGAKFGVSIYKLAVVSNHIHILLRATYRKGFVSFLRAITGIIARIALGAERGRAKFAGGGKARYVEAACHVRETSHAKATKTILHAKGNAKITHHAEGTNCAEGTYLVKSTGRTKGIRNAKITRFWDQRPWTRIIAWMRDFKNVNKYVQQNFNEALGFVPYKPRKHASSVKKPTISTA